MELHELSPEEREKRKRLLAATLITCMALGMVGGAIHVVQLGANRMADMRDRATYDLDEEHDRIRAAGEEITRHAAHEAGKKAGSGRVAYSLEQVQDLLTPEQWIEIGKMVEIPAGEFILGTSKDGADPQNTPERTVHLDSYLIDKYPVTVAQYALFVADTGYAPPLDWKDGEIPKDKLLHPVTMVSWFDAQAYAEWAGKRLVDEYEWEKAARGQDGRRWPWGSRMDVKRLNTYYSHGSTTTVDTFKSGVSPFGVMDLAGNVSEWVANDFKPYPGSAASGDIFLAKIPVAGSAEDQQKKLVSFELSDKVAYKVLRGGSWKSDPFSTSSYHRNFAFPNGASDFFGFRCAKDSL